VQAEGARVLDQHAENAAAARKVPDRRPGVGVVAVVTNRSRPVPLVSTTPRAAYVASVTRAAASTIRWRTASSESSKLIAMPVSSSVLRRSGFALRTRP
jgi:hypothetical protein